MTHANATTDLSYLKVDSLFTAFTPNTPAGEVAWKDLAKQTEGTGKVLNIHVNDTVRQLKAAGYSVSKAVLCREHQISDDEIFKALFSDEEADPGSSEGVGVPRFKVGDVVCFTNDYGVEWHGRRIIGIDEPDKWGNRYYCEPSEAPWMYQREANLSLETLGIAELKQTLLQDHCLAQHCERHPGYLAEIASTITQRNQH